jgi:hypothetical protein
MEQLLIHTNSANTKAAIKEFVNQFKDATIEEQEELNDAYYLKNYGLTKANFESQLNKGIAESILGITKPWETIKQELLAKIANK